MLVLGSRSAFELLDCGFSSAVAADASGPYLAAAKEEAARREGSEALSFVHGDFVELAPSSRLPTSSRSIASSAVTRGHRVRELVCAYPPLRDSD